MKLDAMLDGILPAPAEADQIEITSVTADSRYVAPGSLFAALPGSQIDGAKFVPDAVEAGASAILTGLKSDIGNLEVPVVRVADPRRILALLAARFYARQPENIVAVTGTSGKTSVADFTRQIFSALGRQSASVGTIGIIKPDGSVYGSLTTPDPVTLHMELAVLADEGVTHLAFEASSHGLDQRRLDGVEIKAAAFTNLGRDHLDYHPTIEQYFQSKQRLFDALLPGSGCAVINIDLPESEAITDICERRGLQMIRVGSGEVAEMWLRAQEPDDFGQRLSIDYGGASYEVTLPLIGRYQGSNAMLAAGLALAIGEQPESVFAAMNVLQGVRGRLEVVSNIRGATVVVDYAHKPDALDAALDALRPFVGGKLISVFGCGGDRDRGKRPIMGEISANKADLTIVTDDNPRSEEPATVRAEILAACPDAVEIGDRYEAIAYAMMQLAPGDVLLIAGKGHETGQIIGDQVLPFSDHDAVEAVSLEL
ncbi:MAG: UDP-N-acetylmuramoyl-L-alanyl-D-glutamate--2,6-diaminopimelate ligase [Alphaproteobacteria bacterium]|jgi:UDP-N-acetylmuramoyl-L-alanyl-D-glutamate--2,6-diaminopimelate ligase